MSEATYTVERSVLVDAGPARVQHELVDFHRWTAWSPWEDLDPDLRRTFSGAADGVGSVYEWSGNRRAGQGRMEIIDVEPDDAVVVDLRFLKPFRSQSVVTFRTEPEGSGTRVTWSMTGRRTAALKVMGLFTSMDKLVGKDFEKGLARLKAVVETAGG